VASGHADLGAGRLFAAVGVATVTDVDDVYDSFGISDGVADPVFPAAGSPLALEGFPKWSADAARVLTERATDELEACPGDRFRQPLR